MIKRKSEVKIILAMALIGTLAAVSACAPASKSSKFHDRTSQAPAGASQAEKLTHVRNTSTKEGIDFAKSIVAIQANVTDSKGTVDGKSKVDDLAQALQDGTLVTSDEAPVTKPKTTNGLTPSVPQVQSRNPYFIDVALTLADIGTIEFGGKSDAWGANEAFKTLKLVNPDCINQIPDIKVRATCSDKACSSLSVEVVKSGPSNLVHVEVLAIKTNDSQEDVDVKTYVPYEQKVSATTTAQAAVPDNSESAAADDSASAPLTQEQIDNLMNTKAVCKATTTSAQAPATTNAAPANSTPTTENNTTAQNNTATQSNSQTNTNSNSTDSDSGNPLNDLSGT